MSDPTHLVAAAGDKRSLCGIKDPMPRGLRSYAAGWIGSGIPVCPDCLAADQLPDEITAALAFEASLTDAQRDERQQIQEILASTRQAIQTCNRVARLMSEEAEVLRHHGFDDDAEVVVTLQAGAMLWGRRRSKYERNVADLVERLKAFRP